MSVNINTATVDAVVSVWEKLPEEVRYKVIEATNRLIVLSKELSEDMTGQARGEADKIYNALSAEEQRGLRDTFDAIAQNITIEE